MAWWDIYIYIENGFARLLLTIDNFDVINNNINAITITITIKSSRKFQQVFPWILLYHQNASEWMGKVKSFCLKYCPWCFPIENELYIYIFSWGFRRNRSSAYCFSVSDKNWHQWFIHVLCSSLDMAGIFVIKPKSFFFHSFLISFNFYWILGVYLEGRSHDQKCQELHSFRKRTQPKNFCKC